MKKIILFQTILCAALILNVAVNAQTAPETTSDATTAAATAKTADTVPPAAAPDSKPARVAPEKPFDKEANVSAPPQQTTAYVRPTKEARLKRYLSDAFGVPAVIGSTFGATFSHIGNDPPEWRKTAGGFGKRFASAYGTNAIRNSVSFGISEAFKLENRFEKSGQKNFGKRLKHVFVGSYTTRTKTGKRLPDFPHFIGTYSAAIIANETWMPDRFSYKDGLRDGTISLGIRFGVNLLREFIFPK